MRVPAFSLARLRSRKTVPAKTLGNQGLGEPW
jgi:hypothetical protein